MSRTIFFFMALIFSVAAYPVSRVGGGTLMNAFAGFETAAPNRFSKTLISETSNVRFGGGDDVNSGVVGTRRPMFIMSYLLKNEQPRWIGKVDRKEFRSHFLNQGWQEVAHEIPCVQVFRKESDTQLTWILSWGAGNGVIFTGPKNIDQVQTSMQAMVQELKLLEGACQWK